MSINNQTLSTNLYEVLLVADRINMAEAKSILSVLNSNYRIIQSHIPGIVPALNLGLDNVSSKYVARMDEDDIMMTTRLEKQLRYLEDNHDVHAVGGQIILIDEDEGFLGIGRYRKKIRLNEKDLLMSSPLAHPATMYRLESVRSVGGYRDFLPEDWDLWVRLREQGQIENLDESILKYRVHQNQLSREKMYKQAVGRQYVATSYFARQFNLKDHPETIESSEEWLYNTQAVLRTISSDYLKFEKFNGKLQEINSIIESTGIIELICKTVTVGIRFPFMLNKFIVVGFLKRLRRHFL